MQETGSGAERWICVYCGSRDGHNAAYRQGAAALGRALASAGLGLVYGGARVGLMGAVANAALAGGAPVIGVIPRALVDREVAHAGLTALRVVESMHERKQAMIDAADGFVALPGGFGTLEELFEVLTWGQIGWHDKPVGLLDVDGFHQPLLACMTHLCTTGFVASAHLERLVVDADAAALVAALSDRLAAASAGVGSA